MGKKTPDAPDYTRAAEQTAEGNLRLLEAQTLANRPQQYTPWGSSEWAQDPETGQWTQRIGLSPQLQQSLAYQQQLQQQRSGLAGSFYDRVAGEMGQPPDYSQFTEWGAIPEAGQFDPSQRYVQSAEDAIYGQWERRMEPQMQQQSAALDTQLRNQGLRPGDEAYDYQMQQLRQSQADARTGAQYQATMGAGTEAQRMLGMDLGAQGQTFRQGMMSGQMQNTLRQAQIAEDLQRRGWSLNEINALLTGQQVGMPQMPSFTQAGRVAGPDYMGAAQAQYGADLDAFNAEQMGLQGLMSGGASLGSAWLLGR